MQNIQGLPDQLIYQNIKPVGWMSKFKEWPVEPLSSNMYWNPNQILRFQIDITNGVMDPYRSHLVFNVSSPTAANMPVGGLQVDNSAQSFISTMVITSRNAQIERILQYDTLAAYLTDIGFSQIITQNRQGQGLGYGTISRVQTVEMSAHGHSIPCNITRSTTVDNTLVIQNSATTRGLMPSKKSPVNYGVYMTQGNNGYTSATGFGQISSHISTANYLNNQAILNAGGSTAICESLRTVYGRFSNQRVQYNSQTRLRDYIDSTTSYLTDNTQLTAGVIPATWKTGGTSTNPYITDFPTTKIGHLFRDAHSFDSYPNIAPLWGYNKPYSRKLGVGGGQPMLSPTIPQCQLGYGSVLAKPVPITQKRFQIPLLSSVLGVLIHCDNFRLIPMRALKDTIIELTLNPYAMFTTGRADVHQFDTTGILNQIKRDFSVSRMFYNLHLYQWPDQYLLRHVMTSLSKEISIIGSSWSLSGQYQVATGQNIASNSWQIATGPQSLGQVVVLFISNQYLKYSFCRKQFRLSNNIRSAQLKHNVEYYPPQPIVGNAGNPQNIDNTGDNYDFFQKLLSSNSYKFTGTLPQPRINTHNFAINARPYDTTRTSSLYDPLMFNNKTYAYTANSVNTDTAMGYPNFHQNRCIGRAAYTFNFAPYGHSKNVIVGLNTRQSRPMEVNFDVHTTNYFPTDQTMYIFTRANVMIIYGDGYIKVEGR